MLLLKRLHVREKETLPLKLQKEVQLQGEESALPVVRRKAALREKAPKRKGGAKKRGGGGKKRGGGAKKRGGGAKKRGGGGKKKGGAKKRKKISNL